MTGICVLEVAYLTPTTNEISCFKNDIKRFTLLIKDYPVLYIQLVNRPHFGMGILLFGSFGQSGQ